MPKLKCTSAPPLHKKWNMMIEDDSDIVVKDKVPDMERETESNGIKLSGITGTGGKLPLLSPLPSKPQMTSTPISRRPAANDSGYCSPQLLAASPGSCHAEGTPPLCGCGRRTRRRQVYKPGPNTGRLFWSCSLKGRNTTAGCRFFAWATSE